MIYELLYQFSGEKTSLGLTLLKILYLLIKLLLSDMNFNLSNEGSCFLCVAC